MQNAARWVDFDFLFSEMSSTGMDEESPYDNDNNNNKLPERKGWLKKNAEK